MSQHWNPTNWEATLPTRWFSFCFQLQLINGLCFEFNICSSDPSTPNKVACFALKTTPKAVITATFAAKPELKSAVATAVYDLLVWIVPSDLIYLFQESVNVLKTFMYVNAAHDTKAVFK